MGDSLRCWVGYDFLYWSNVVRPGDQVSREVDARTIPTAAAFNPGFQPATVFPSFTHSDFWAQGVSFGLEYQY